MKTAKTLLKEAAKPRPKAKKPLKPATERQQKYIDAVMTGHTPSAILGDPRDCLHSETVAGHLAIAREQLTDITQIRRVTVVEGILSAIERAKLISEPGTEIAGWREIGKILGHYAPEVKRLVLTDDQDKVIRKLESLSTAELIDMVQRKRTLVLEGEAKRVD